MTLDPSLVLSDEELKANEDAFVDTLQLFIRQELRKTLADTQATAEQPAAPAKSGRRKKKVSSLPVTEIPYLTIKDALELLPFGHTTLGRTTVTGEKAGRRDCKNERSPVSCIYARRQRADERIAAILPECGVFGKRKDRAGHPHDSWAQTATLSLPHL